MHFEYRKNRPEEVSFIVDSPAHVENVAPLLVANSISIISASAATLFVLIRLLSSVTRGFCCGGTAEPRSFADSRVSAIVLLSPQGEGIMGLSVHSWDDVDLI
jgi:hypothetical protein